MPDVFLTRTIDRQSSRGTAVFCAFRPRIAVTWLEYQKFDGLHSGKRISVGTIKCRGLVFRKTPCQDSPPAVLFLLGIVTMNRRRFLQSTTTAAAAGLSVSAASAAGQPVSAKPKSVADAFRYCLNSSTIREQTKDIKEQIRIAAAAGYDSIEPWMRHLEAFQQAGGSLTDLRKMLKDSGLTVESAIGFANWIVDDDARRKAGLEQARRDMGLLAEIGGTRIAAPPVGAHSGGSPKLDLFVVAKRYRALLEVGDMEGVVPQLEVWGFSPNLSRLGESVMVCVEASHPQACLLPDVYHIFRGGSEFGGLDLLHDQAVHVFHMNDYPAEPAREQMKDADRVYPGDGVAPLSDILNMIGGRGREVVLSLELFNPQYYRQDAEVVAKTGLAKMKQAVATAIA